MATVTPVAPSLTPAVLTPATPTAADVIPAAAYRGVWVIIETAATNTPTFKFDDPVTPAIPNATTPADPDLTVTTVISQKRGFYLDCGRFRDSQGNINYTVTGTITGTTILVTGIS